MYRYRHIETALARVFNVMPEGMGAFRARLRHLRNIGVPELPKPGSGEQINYTRENAIEILLALELEALGVSPRHAAAHAKLHTEQASRLNDMDERKCLIVTPAEIPPGVQYLIERGTGPPQLTLPGPGIATTLQPFTPSLVNVLLEGSSRRFAAIKVVRSLAELDNALRTASAA